MTDKKGLELLLPGAQIMEILLLFLLLQSLFLLGVSFNFLVNPGNFHNTIVTKGEASLLRRDYISLTQVLSDSRRDSVGRALYNAPVQVLDPLSGKALSFQASFVFKIVSYGVPADGMTFLLSPVDQSFSELGNSGGGHLGFNQVGTDGNTSNHVFGVEFDTYQNIPYDTYFADHLGVNVNGVNSTVTWNANGQLTLLKNLTLQALIRYNGDTEQLQVWMAVNGSDMGQPLIVTNVSLGNVLLPEMMVGFSAATGSSSEEHNIYSWDFNVEDPPLPPPVPEPSVVEFPDPKPESSSNLLVKILVPVSLLALGGGLVIVFYLQCARKKARPPCIINQLTNFTYKELHAATRGFSPKNLLGKGGSCSVYRGFIPVTNSEVAVKVLVDASKQKVAEQFVAELTVISTVRHQNLVALRGWCQDNNKMLLVYEFMPNGSLDQFLFPKQPRLALTWKQRYGVLKGVAEGLAYLHDGLEKRIVHRDVKSANVLLDENFGAKLGDFGLARLIEQAQGAQTMTKAGTVGFIAPELAYSGRATEKSDVYSFGILALEIVTGRKAVDFTFTKASEEDAVLVDWVWRKHESGELRSVVDARLVVVSPSDEETEILGVLEMGMVCSLTDANSRPSMRKCCEFLSGGGETCFAELPQQRPRAVTINLCYDTESTIESSSSSTSRLFNFSSSS